MFRRETIIALRARRQAYRIASDVAHPPLAIPPPPVPDQSARPVRSPHETPPGWQIDRDQAPAWPACIEVRPASKRWEFLNTTTATVVLVIIAILFAGAGLILCIYG